MQFKVTEYNKNKRAVTTTEEFFSLKNFRQRGPDALAEEFKQIQEENLKVNRNFHIILKDAETMGVPKNVLRKILKQRGISSRDSGKLLRGINIPYKGYDGRMKKRVKEARKLAKERGESINPNYFYPRKRFLEIVREYNRKKLIPEIKTEDRTGTEINTGIIDSIRDFIGDRFNRDQTSRIQTPALPNTPTPKVQTAANINPITGLTRTQQALLSPEEQVIARRT